MVRNEHRQTGGGPQTASLSEEDLKIINILSLDSVGGMEDIPETDVWDLTVSVLNLIVQQFILYFFVFVF